MTPSTLWRATATFSMEPMMTHSPELPPTSICVPVADMISFILVPCLPMINASFPMQGISRPTSALGSPCGRGGLCWGSNDSRLEGWPASQPLPWPPRTTDGPGAERCLGGDRSSSNSQSRSRSSNSRRRSLSRRCLLATDGANGSSSRLRLMPPPSPHPRSNPHRSPPWPRIVRPSPSPPSSLSSMRSFPVFSSTAAVPTRLRVAPFSTLLSLFRSLLACTR
mmetsp:Transcript_37621/g.60389  ORF Transcript_37621/g.60389 Transcript_37621/m.60389 type:complete len:223 (+) Transcript_37621:1172-1840(+)